MKFRMICHHGHRLKLHLDRPGELETLVCPFCGSLTTPRAIHDTQRQSGLDITMNGLPAAQSDPSGSQAPPTGATASQAATDPTTPPDGKPSSSGPSSSGPSSSGPVSGAEAFMATTEGQSTEVQISSPPPTIEYPQPSDSGEFPVTGEWSSDNEAAAGDASHAGGIGHWEVDDDFDVYDSDDFARFPETGDWDGGLKSDGAESGAFGPTAVWSPDGADSGGPVTHDQGRRRRRFIAPPRVSGFEITRELGRGGMGVVYLARDLEHDRTVALKTLQRVNASGLHQFKREFRSLADIAHPNLASVYSLLEEKETWWFTMEFLDGVTFLEYVWSGFERLESGATPVPGGNPEDRQLTAERISRMRSALKQLAIGLNTLHERDMLHRDVKPSNVMVTRDGRLVLLDFGLVAQARSDQLRSGLIQGTPEYMAPEQGGSGPVSAASDWYAVGVMLYEVLTGRLPFRGTPLKMLLQKQTEMPQDPIELEHAVPPEWNSLCMALLETDPALRPTTEQVLERIGEQEAASVVRERKRRSTPAVHLVGRESHLVQLREAFAKVVAGETRSVFVHGRSGMGKSVLVHRFLEEIRERESAIVLDGRCSEHDDSVVLRGRCYEQESVPFKALDSLIDSLSVYLIGLGKQELRAVMPEDVLALNRVFPVLGQVELRSRRPQPSIENADQQELRQRALGALRELFTKLGRQRPLVLYIDDLQWGDQDSASLLVDLVRPPDPPRLLLLGSYRSEDVDTSQCLLTMAAAYRKGRIPPHREEISVDVLPEEDAFRLALKLLESHNDQSERQAQKIARESGGSPFFVWELAQHVADGSEAADGTLELDEVIWQRACRLSPDTRELLELVAVSGRPIRTRDALQAVGEATRGPRMLAELRTSNFLRITGLDDETMVECYHDRIRETVVKHLQRRIVRQHSLLLASVLEKAGDVTDADLMKHIEATPDYDEPGRPMDLAKRQWRRIFDLAHYLDLARAHRPALPYALAAAEQARSQNALEVAQQQYEIALRGAEHAEAPIRFRIAEGLGDVLMLRGRYADAKEQFAVALELAQGDLIEARIEGKLGELAFKQGDMRIATEHIERALQELGRKPPQCVPWIYLLVAKEGLIQLLHTKFPKRFLGRRSLDDATTDLIAVHLYDRLSYAYWFSRGLIQTFWAHLRQINLAETYPPTLALAQAYSLHAPVMSSITMFDRGVAYAEKSFAIRQAKGDLWGQGQSLHFHGVVLFAASRFEECIERCREAIRLLEQTGDKWEENMARYHVADSLCHLGRLEEAVEEARRVYRTGLEVGDVQGSTLILIVWAGAASTGFPVDEIHTELERKREDPLATLQIIQAKGLKLLLHDDRPDQAADVFQEAIKMSDDRGIKNTYVMANYSWRATCLRLQAERADPNSKDRQRLLRQARKAARLSLRRGRKFQNILPHALRENGIVAAMTGRERTAQRYFDESLAVAQRQGAAYQLALTQLAKAEAGCQFGWTNAEQDRQQAVAAVNRLKPQ